MVHVQVRNAIGFERSAADRVTVRVSESGAALLPCAFLAVPVHSGAGASGSAGSGAQDPVSVGLEPTWELVPTGNAHGPSAALDDSFVDGRASPSRIGLSPARSLLRLANVSFDDTRGTCTWRL